MHPKSKKNITSNSSKKLTNILLIIALIVGLGLLAYPSVSDYVNSLHSTRAIAYYSESMANVDKADYESYLAAAREYNKNLLDKPNRFNLSEEERQEYKALLNLSDNGIMGYIEIPKIKVSLPIYHGTAESALQVGVGHIEGSSLPVGGESTHCVLSGHRGLPSAKLFTDIDELEVGDVFTVRVLDELLTYEVDQIRIVLPDELDDLDIDLGRDLCTLVTCTPYGINTHRLLVRGHRIENTESALNVRISSDASVVEPMLVAPAIALPILLIVFIILMSGGKKKRKKKN